MAKNKINYGSVDLLTGDTFNSSTAKERITIWLDEEILELFRKRAEKEGTKYQTLLNQALREAARKPSLVERVEILEKKLARA